ncbi:MAG: hypothetical protein P8Q97_12355 [Myxococcota bacterium]|jgi:hypothetical protein|nr:hypothetical protein [Myxococcota bacterium]
MNGWDIFTYFCCVVLAGSALGIFVFFLRDAKGIIMGSREEDEDPG